MIIHQRFPSVPASVIQVRIQQGQVLVTDNVQVIRNDREYQSLQKSLLSKKLRSVSREISKYFTSNRVAIQIISHICRKILLKCQIKAFRFSFKKYYTITLAVTQAILSPQPQQRGVLQLRVLLLRQKLARSLSVYLGKYTLLCIFNCSVLQFNKKKLKCSCFTKPHFTFSIMGTLSFVNCHHSKSKL